MDVSDASAITLMVTRSSGPTCAGNPNMAFERWDPVSLSKFDAEMHSLKKAGKCD